MNRRSRFLPSVGMTSSLRLQLPSQTFHELPYRLLIAPIPAPLAMFGGVDQSRPGQDRHVMRDGRLRKPNPFLDFSSAQTMTGDCLGSGNLRAAFLQCQQNSPSRGVGHCVQRTIEGFVGRHGGLEITRKSMEVNVEGGRRWTLIPASAGYFFTMGLYPSATSLVRMASASLMSVNGPNCTRNSLSGAAGATNAG